MKNVVTLRGERELWIEFIHKVKKEKKRAWDVLSPFLRKYVSSDQDTRVLLILFPKGLVDQLLAKDNPDAFIQEAIKKYLDRGR